MASANDVPLYLTLPFFKRVLEHGLQVDNLKVLDVKIRNLTRGGENYCSNIYSANVQYQNSDQEPQERWLIVKSMPEEKQAILARLHIYNKETLFYLDIKPKLETLMWCTKESWHLGARHYFSTTTPEQTIVFEDLTREGYELKCRQLGLDGAHATLVMRKLAQFHALTMVMAQKEPQTIMERYPFGLLHLDAIKSEPFKLLFGTQLLKLAALVSDDPCFYEINRKLYKYHEHFTERVLKAIYPLRGGINVLNHGDLWVNNILFNYGPDHRLANVKFIDFQLCFYGSLGFDINYFLNTSLELNVLKEQRQFLIDTYYETFADTLKQLPYDQAPPTYDEVLKEIQAREAYGFFVAFGFFPLMSMISTDSEDNTLQNFHDEEFARQKVQLMFEGNTRTLETLKYTLQRLDDLQLFD